MPPPAPDEPTLPRFFTRELPVLQEVYRREEVVRDEGGGVNDLPTSEDVVEALDGALPRGQVLASLQRLGQEGYVDGAEESSLAEDDFFLALTVTARGRRLLGDWPADDAGTRLLEHLEALLVQEQDQGRRRALSRLLESAREVGVSVVGGLVVAAGQGVVM